MDAIKRGLRQSIIPNKTLGDLFDYYLAHRTVEKKRKRDDESIIRVHLRPYFGAIQLSAICVKEIDAFKVSRNYLNKKTLHHLLALFNSMLRVAHDLRWLANLPRVKKTKLTLFEKDFKYLRTEDEIRRFLAAAFDEGPMVYDLYSTAVYTGMRQGELAALRWEDVNFESKKRTIQQSFSGPTKNGEVRDVPIFDILLPTLLEHRMKPPGTARVPK